MATTNYTCFFISPIGPPDSQVRQHSDEVMKRFLLRSLRALGFKSENIVRSDQLGTPNIQETMEKCLKEYDLCIVDITGYNANVMYEYGFRRGIGKAIIVIEDDSNNSPEGANQKHPFDIYSDRIIRYSLLDIDVLYRAIDELEKQVTDRIGNGFFNKTGEGSVSDINNKLQSIENKLDRVLSKATIEREDEKVDSIIRQAGSPISAFNYALSRRDVILAEQLLPRVEAVSDKEKYLDAAVSQTAAMGSDIAAEILIDEWDYITKYFTIKQRYEELGCLVSYCSRKDKELEYLDFLLGAAKKLLADTKEDKYRAGVYNQMNRLLYGAYRTEMRKKGIENLDRLNQAIDYLQKAIDIAPQDPSYRYNLAICLRESGDANRALEEINECIKLNREAGKRDDDHLRLAYQLYKAAGKLDEANAIRNEINPIIRATLDD